MNTSKTAPIPYYLRPNKQQQDMNHRMEELVPEFRSNFSKTPMVRNRWYSPAEEYKPGVPCYIAVDYTKNEPAKMEDYIWIPKNRCRGLSAGYYHFVTREAHAELYYQFQSRRSRRHLRFRKNDEMKQTLDLEFKIHDLLQNRIISDRPNDVHAARMRLLNLKSQGNKAKAFGHATYLPTITTAILLGLTH